MDIDLNTALNANRAVDARFADAHEIVSDKSAQLKGGEMLGPALTVTERQLTGLEVFDEHADDDLRRDDPLGKLVLSAFDLKAPDVPEFI
ncbi:MAG: hypothetical protein E7046_08175 [Lentisphaerae bacterium]|nr:hypothetical protein [Lentisphaerota bacterium]